jgi:hypothetical protein
MAFLVMKKAFLSRFYDFQHGGACLSHRYFRMRETSRTAPREALVVRAA